MMKGPECGGCALAQDSPAWAKALARASAKEKPDLLRAARTVGVPDGPPGSSILFLGESLGKEEVEAVVREAEGEPTNFVGPAGRLLNKGIARLGQERKDCRVGNVVACRPPWDQLVDRPWTYASIKQCEWPRRRLLSEPRQAIVTLGVTPTRAALEHFGYKYEGRLENWHGYVIGDEPPFIIPSFHPSFLLHDNLRFSYVFYRDVGLGFQVAKQGFKRGEVSLTVDPDPAWFAWWADQWNP